MVDIQATQVTIRWEPLGYNVTRCHSYNLTVQHRSKVGGKEETREEVCYDTQSRDPQHTIHNLTPFTNLSVKLVLRNPEGVMESKELEVQTDEDGERPNFELTRFYLFCERILRCERLHRSLAAAAAVQF